MTEIQNNLSTVADSEESKGPLRSVLNRTLDRIDNRLTKAKMDAALQTGTSSYFNDLGLSSKVHAALNKIVGVIFHVEKYQKSDGTITEKVKGVGSGMALPNDITHSATDISGKALDRVLTCTHVLTSKEKEKIEIYFVPNFMLHKSGLPKREYLLTCNDIGLIHFLRTHPNSFHLNPFCVKRTDTSSQEFKEGLQPQYYSDEDVVAAYIEPRTAQLLLTLTDPMQISLVTASQEQTAIERYLKKMRDNQTAYYAIGYPGMDHHSVDQYVSRPSVPNDDAYENLIDTHDAAPLIVSMATSSPDTVEDTHPDLSGNRIVHKALTAKGMSGGPLITCTETPVPTIEIIGVITSATEENEYACYWK